MYNGLASFQQCHSSNTVLLRQQYFKAIFLKLTLIWQLFHAATISNRKFLLISSLLLFPTLDSYPLEKQELGVGLKIHKPFSFQIREVAFNDLINT